LIAIVTVDAVTVYGNKDIIVRSFELLFTRSCTSCLTQGVHVKTDLVRFLYTVWVLCEKTGTTRI
ncbi:hypothetical protein T4D_10189, partial [Trichinella pseudospiralis]